MKRAKKNSLWAVVTYGLVFVFLLAPAPWTWVAAEDDIPDIEDMINDELESGAVDPEFEELERVIAEEEGAPIQGGGVGDDALGLPDDSAFEDGTVTQGQGIAPGAEPGVEVVGPDQQENFVVGDEALGLPPEMDLEKEVMKAESQVQTQEFEELDNFEDFDEVERDLGAVPEGDFVDQGTPEVFQGEPGAQGRITNLEFRMDGANSRIIVSSDKPLRYREVKNPSMGQTVFYFTNTVASDAVQRAYDTTEFPSPVALFTLLQVPGSTPPQAKLIVQMREKMDASVIPTDRGLFIDFGPPTQKSEARLVFDRSQSGKASEENIYGGGQNFTGRIIRRLEIKDSDVQDVLRLIARTSGYNIVVGDEVSGKVGTLSLENIPWDQAFTLVLQMKKLGYIRQGNVLRVATLRSLSQEKQEALANEQAKIRVEPLKTLLIPVSYANAKTLSPKAQPFLTERGSIDVDDRTNTVIVKDVNEVVERVKKLFRALDTQPPRVNISARIVELTNNFSRNIGVNSLRGNGSVSGVNLNTEFALSDTDGGPIILSAADFANLRIAFDLAETENKARTLANPSVSVVANQAAKINQSNSFFIETAVPAAGGPVQGRQQITTNLALEVTPIVAADGTIFLTVNVTNEVPSGSGADTTIDGRSLESQVLVENGDTVVVGSIFSNTIRNNVTGVPFLMRFPVLGYFFKRRETTDNRSETFLFLTAKIMNAEDSFKQTL